MRTLSTLRALLLDATPRRRWWIVLPLAAMAVIFWGSSIPGDPELNPGGIAGLLLDLAPDVQNLLHIPAYAALAAAWRYALPAWGVSGRRAMLTAVGLTILFAISDEFHQGFVPGRTPSLLDIGSDTLGALFVAALWPRR